MWRTFRQRSGGGQPFDDETRMPSVAELTHARPCGHSQQYRRRCNDECSEGVDGLYGSLPSEYPYYHRDDERGHRHYHQANFAVSSILRSTLILSFSVSWQIGRPQTSLNAIISAVEPPLRVAPTVRRDLPTCTACPVSMRVDVHANSRR